MKPFKKPVDSSSSSSAGGSKRRQNITVTLAIARQWKMVGINQSLNTDCEIASFLLHLYNRPDNKAKTECISCINCKKMLSVAFCPECALTYCTSRDLADLEGCSKNRQALPDDASPSVVIKLENNVGECNEHLTNHFENSAIQTDQKESPAEEKLANPPCRRSIRKLCRKPKRYTAADEDQDFDIRRLSRKPKRSSAADDDEDYKPPQDKSSESSSDSQAPSPKPRVIKARLGRPPKTACKELPSSTAVLKDRALATENAQKQNSVDSDNNTQGDTSVNDNVEASGDQMSDADSDTVCQSASVTGGCGQRQGKSNSGEGDNKGGRSKQQRKTGEFPCDICGSVFKEAYLRRRHKHIHSAEHGQGWLYKCEQCKRPFRQKGLYDAHMRMHSGTKLFVCGACDADFAVSKQLKRHVQAQHNDVLATRACYKCSLCQSAFSVYKKYSNHMYRHTLNKNQICEICSKAFSEPSLLATHMRVHTDERPFTCQECGHSFRQMGSLSSHMQRHKGEKNYSCHLCPMKYYSKHNLKMHLAAHKGEKSYLCQLCGAGYTNSKSLQVHMRSHTGERPFKCEVCGKDFARPSSYKQHVLIHTNVRPYSCHICSITFKDSSNFRRHHRLKHAGQERKTRTGRPKGGPPPVPRSSDIARNLPGVAGGLGGVASLAGAEPVDAANVSAAVNSFQNFVKQEMLGSGYSDRGEREALLDGGATLTCKNSGDSSFEEGGRASENGRCNLHVTGSRSALDSGADADSRLVTEADQLQQSELHQLLSRQQHYHLHYQF